MKKYQLVFYFKNGKVEYILTKPTSQEDIEKIINMLFMSFAENLPVVKLFSNDDILHIIKISEVQQVMIHERKESR